jgi:hypothetical protein
MGLCKQWLSLMHAASILQCQSEETQYYIQPTPQRIAALNLLSRMFAALHTRGK